MHDCHAKQRWKLVRSLQSENEVTFNKLGVEFCRALVHGCFDETFESYCEIAPFNYDDRPAFSEPDGGNPFLELFVWTGQI